MKIKNLKRILYLAFVSCVSVTIYISYLVISSNIQIEVFLGYIGILVTILSILLMFAITINSNEEITRRDTDLIANSIISTLSQKDINDNDLKKFGPNANAIAEDLANRGVIQKKIKQDNGEFIYYTLKVQK